jgi:hypothetical protein
MKLSKWNYPPEGPTALHRRSCSVCGRIGTYYCYEVGEVIEKSRIRSLDSQLRRFMKALLED